MRTFFRTYHIRPTKLTFHRDRRLLKEQDRRGDMQREFQDLQQRFTLHRPLPQLMGAQRMRHRFSHAGSSGRQCLEKKTRTTPKPIGTLRHARFSLYIRFSL
jgi:hypothetical protein